MEKENQTEEGLKELETSILEDIQPKEPVAEPKKETQETEKEDAEESEESFETDSKDNEEKAEEVEDIEETEETDGKTKRIQELAAQKRRLEAELTKLKTQSTSSDPELEKLEKMSNQELKSLKREVQIAWKNEQDAEKSRKLLDLQDKIDSVVQSAPTRFNNTQLASFQSAVGVTQDEMGDSFTVEAQKSIYARAKAVFDKYPSLQNSVDGQALAWEQAVDWYKDTSKFNSTKQKASDTNRELNKLKKKMSIDTATARGAQKETENSRLFKAAKSGDKKASVDWVKSELGL